MKQAHEKVVAKEKEYSAKMEDIRKRNDEDIEKKVAEKVKFVAKKLDEESAKRRALFNQLQELKGNIRVYCRVRPCLSDEEKAMGTALSLFPSLPLCLSLPLSSPSPLSLSLSWAACRHMMA